MRSQVKDSLRSKLTKITVVYLALLSVATQAASSDNWRLAISKDGLRIQKANGSDWYWLGDTAWSLFQELNREDAESYFATRASQGFTVVQAVVVMGWNREWNDENVYGHRPFHDGDADKPKEAFWQHADWLLNKAKEFGLYVALLPAWGSYWGQQATVEYARWITNRYKDHDNIIWVNGGDRKVGSAKGLFSQIGQVFHTDEDTLATFHPRGGDYSSRNFHTEKWLDFNMQQSSHGKRDIRADNVVDSDLAKTPTKPTLNGEPNYEDHCVGWKRDCGLGTFNAHDVRQLGYWTVLAGATGITYGHVHVWDFYHGGNKEDGLKDWKVEVKDPGAVQMGYLANLMMSRPHKGRAPAQHILTDESPSGLKQRAIMGSGYAFVYTSQGHKMHVNLDRLPWEKKKAWWFNPRDGQATQIDRVPQSGHHMFDPPGNSGGDNDWVLVIDEASKSYTAPGRATAVKSPRCRDQYQGCLPKLPQIQSSYRIPKPASTQPETIEIPRPYPQGTFSATVDSRVPYWLFLVGLQPFLAILPPIMDNILKPVGPRSIVDGVKWDIPDKGVNCDADNHCVACTLGRRTRR